MIYLGNPCSPAVVDAMTAGQLGYIDTPAQGNRRPAGVAWAADNGCFSDRWEQDTWWRFLEDNAHAASSCLFAVAPDVVADAWGTQMRAMPWLAKVRALGYPAAYVVQDGVRGDRMPWNHFDVLFIGGTTEWKLGETARALVYTAKRHGRWVHMGRVNSEKRWRYAQAIGCDSVDGTYLTFGPDQNLPKVLAWTRNNDQDALFPIA